MVLREYSSCHMWDPWMFLYTKYERKCLGNQQLTSNIGVKPAHFNVLLKSSGEQFTVGQLTCTLQCTSTDNTIQRHKAAKDITYINVTKSFAILLSFWESMTSLKKFSHKIKVNFNICAGIKWKWDQILFSSQKPPPPQICYHKPQF